jgi:preprotein translocase subunit SecB
MIPMSETNGAGDAPQTSASENAGPPIVVNVQYVKDFSFENPNAPQSLMAANGPPEVAVNVNVGARGLQPDTYEVTLSMTATAKHQETTAFICEVAYAGIFTLNGVPDEHVQPVLLIECPRLLFPFARAMVADATRDGGFPPLLIQPIDFVDLYRREARNNEAVGSA